MFAEGEQESRLIEAARGGDSRAFDLLVERYQEYLFRLMLRACHHPDDAEDVAVAALARAYEKLEQFEGRSSFVSWLGRIATNLCFRSRERAQFDEAANPQEALEVVPESRRALLPEEEALQSEMRRILRAAVDSLPEPDRTILRLRDIEELSAKQTAAETELTESAVKSRLHRARKVLRTRLNRDFGIIPENEN